MQGSDATSVTKASDDRETQDGETKLEPDIKEEKKEDTPNDEDKKLLDGNKICTKLTPRSHSRKIVLLWLDSQKQILP